MAHLRSDHPPERDICVTLLCHARVSRSGVTLGCHAQVSRSGVTLRCHALSLESVAVSPGSEN